MLLNNTIAFIKKYQNVIKIGISTGILIYIFYKINIINVIDTFNSISITWYSIFLLTLLLGILVASFKWWGILKFEKYTYSLKYILKVFWIGMFYNQFLPGRIGGDAIKLIYLAKNNKKNDQNPFKYKASLSIIIDRFYNIIGLIILGITGIFFNYAQNKESIFTFLAASLIIVLSFVFLLYGDSLLKYKKFQKYQFFKKIQESFIAAKQYLNKVYKNLFMVFWGIAYQFFVILSNFLLGKALGIEIDFEYYLYFIPLLALITIIPISFGGFGIREASYLYFLNKVGIPEEKAILLSLIMYFSLTFITIPGYIYNINGKK